MSREPAASLFSRSNQVVAAGDFAHAARLLAECCRLDPANLLYRQALRRVARARYRNNGRGHWLAWLWNWPVRLRLTRAVAAGRHEEAIRHAEDVLANAPWDVPAQRSLGRAAEALGWLDLALWALEQARTSAPDDLGLARDLARLYERRGHFSQARGLWLRVADADPRDAEAAGRLAQLSRLAEPAADVTASAPPQRDAAELQAAIDADPTAPGPRLALARLHRLAGRLEAAQEALAAGLGPTGGDFVLTIEMADLAIEPFRRHLAIVRDKREERDDDELQQLEADLVREVNTRELDLFRLQADRHPRRDELRYELAVRLLRCGRTDEALEAFLSVPGWKAARGAGYCYRLWGNVRRAVPAFERALEELPADEDEARQELLYVLATGYAEMGEFDRAVECGGELAERSPGYRDVLTLLPGWQARARPAS